jgi:hypothetical protein
MKYQTETDVRSMIYQYGTVPARVTPVIGEESALEQMKLARRLWNVLVAIDRTRRSYFHVMHDDVQERIDKLLEQKNELIKERKRRWQVETTHHLTCQGPLDRAGVGSSTKKDTGHRPRTKTPDIEARWLRSAYNKNFNDLPSVPG